MVGLLRLLAFTIPIVCMLLGAAKASAIETLGDELAAHAIRTDPDIVPGMDRKITSYSVYDGKKSLFIGFYIDNGTGNLGDELHLGRFNKVKHVWKETVIDVRLLPDQVRDASPCSMMAGSVTRIDAAFGNLFVGTHGNPSTGCTLVFSEDLQYRDSVYGFFLGALDRNTLIYQHSEVHFAPTHYVEVSVYDMTGKKSVPLYSPKQKTPLRNSHIGKVRKAYEKMKETGECMRRNHHCDPDLFSCSLFSAHVNPETDSVILQVAFDNKDWMTEDDKLKTEAFRELVHETEAKVPGSPVPDRYFIYLSSDLYRAKSMEKSGWTDRVSHVLGLFGGDDELQGMLRNAIDNPRTTGKMNDRDWFLKLDGKWDSPVIWQRLMKAVKTPPERTQVVYIYRNVKQGPIRFAELYLNDLYQKYGKKDLAEYLDRDVLSRLVK